MRYLFPILIVSLLLVGCKNADESNGIELVAKVGDAVLTRENVESNIPHGLTPEDSLIMAEDYVRSWISDQLMYEVASKNVMNKDQVNKMVENYRKALVINQYQGQLVTERLSREIKEDEMKQYYDSHLSEFVLDKPLIKGFYFRIPQDDPQLGKVQSWGKKVTPSTINSLEKYSLQNTLDFDYFYEQWRDAGSVLEKMPNRLKNEEYSISNDGFIEQRDSVYYYFLHLKDHLLPGETSPFEYAKQAVLDKIVNRRKIEYLRELESDLYQDAVKKGNIIFYKE